MQIIWAVALVLAAGALVWMSALILLRLVHQRRAARELADRRALQAVLLGAIRGGGDVRLAIQPYAGKGHLLAQTLLDFVTILQGADLETVIETLRDAGVEAVLQEGVDHGRGPCRLACIEALGAFKGEASRPTLRRAAARGSPDVRLAALRSLLQTGAEAPLADIVQRLRDEELPPGGPTADFVRLVVERDPGAAVILLDETDDLPPAASAMLLEALGATGAYTAIPTVVDHLTAEQPKVRAAAAVALGMLRHPAAEHSLREAIDDPAPIVRSAAAEAIGAAGLMGLAGALEDHLEDPAWSVRFEAAAALAKLDPPQVGATGEAPPVSPLTPLPAPALMRAEWRPAE